jgi:hypothetical protein
MRLKVENEELKRADKKKQMIEPKGAGGDAYNNAIDTLAPTLTAALARVRARRTTAQGSVPPLPPKQAFVLLLPFVLLLLCWLWVVDTG